MKKVLISFAIFCMFLGQKTYAQYDSLLRPPFKPWATQDQIRDAWLSFNDSLPNGTVGITSIGWYSDSTRREAPVFWTRGQIQDYMATGIVHNSDQLWCPKQEQYPNILTIAKSSAYGFKSSEVTYTVYLQNPITGSWEKWREGIKGTFRIISYITDGSIAKFTLEIHNAKKKGWPWDGEPITVQFKQ